MSIAKLLATVLALTLCACTLQRPAPDTSVVIPQAWRHNAAASEGGREAGIETATQAGPVQQEWWRSFNSAELDRLVAEARANSLDLEAAIARVEQAQTQARIAGAPLLPEIGAAVDARRQDNIGTNTLNGGNYYSAALTASYEVDFWGRNRAARDRARFLLEASRHDREVVQLTVVSGVARLYMQVLGLNERLDISRLNLANAERVLKVVEARMRAGAATQLELAQQRGLVAAQNRTVATLAQQLNEGRIALSILLSRPVPGLELTSDRISTLAQPQLAAGLPSQLLTRRPDIARAEATLAAASANIVTARAAMLPRLQLTASLGTADDRLSGIFDSPAYSLAAGLTAPIFNAGRLAAGRDLAVAQQRELLSDYRSVIITAFADVESALNAIAGLQQQTIWQTQELEQAKRAFTLAEVRYKAGAETLLVMLDAQRTLYNAQEQAVVLTAASTQARVALYRALGGGWDGVQSVRP